ncbi:HAD family hydrolase [Maritimibacter sp. DP1N21-5]|uniref:HAD family hydrolase n=1 Tax=Maritimibacter sp. DP1N21-5 TaxID=2836867 RepID=UPI001C43933D|nr:HAD family hydrolase [Maritimibacter sp. DP1N21-5]
MTALRAVIFDKDGTLFDFAATWGGWTQAALLELAEGDMELARRLGQALGIVLPPDPAGVARFSPGSPAVSGTIAETAVHLAPMLGRDVEDLTDWLVMRAQEVRPAPATDLVRLLGRLSAQRYALALATNDSRLPTERHLEEAGIARLLPHVRTADDGLAPKPAPDMLLSIAADLELHPRAVLMVGDSRADIAAARAAGMPVIAVLTGPAGPGELLDADTTLDHVGRLPGWLAEQARPT